MKVRGIRAPARGATPAGLVVAVVVGVLAAAAVLASCSNHSGLRRLHPSDSQGAASPVALPSGIAGSSSAAASASSTGSRPPSHSASATPTSGAPTRSASDPAGASHGTTRHSGSRSPIHHPSSSKPAPSRSSVPPSPSVAVSPVSGLHGGQQVSVSGAYFTAGDRVDVQQCRTDLSSCALLATRSATADAGGRFATPFVVSTMVQLSTCGAHGCVIEVRRGNGDVFVVPISFG